MTQSSKTPPDLTIQPRDMAFGRDAPSGRWWLGGDPVGTAFYNALSATFPLGERFFMDSVRRYRNVAPAKLKAQIAGFLAQEAMHTREHIFFNKQIADHGFDIAAMEDRTRARLDYARTRPPLQQLGATIALEHFTAILAHALLADPRHLEGASDEARAMWRWHAIEEVEHKSVAYDVYMAAAASLPAPRRWTLRVLTMVAATHLLFAVVGSNIADIFTSDGINNGRTWRRLFHFMLVRPGMLRQVMGSYFAYFLPGFHPWQHDNRALVSEVEQTLAATYGVGAPA
ncbi:putative metal-dependent hydrolase [Caulobacter sp. AP07]|uniref:metal-dependent hydrolase n=1 Tax=Caulobacter sp. AP07 TaxID=1144304 RepID=UPI000271FD15|nr:metal-dependent hydrolase [Caulobacter sp. AP07]EJL22496.1 putative metal-dependent hydrolase [Caulobacter sp. AP07]